MRPREVQEGMDGPTFYRKIRSLPALEDLNILQKKDPDGLYKAAVKLRVDRDQLENDVLIPLRRAIAEMINLRSIVLGDGPVMDDEGYAEDKREAWMESALNGLLDKLEDIEKALLTYEGKEGMELRGEA